MLKFFRRAPAQRPAQPAARRNAARPGPAALAADPPPLPEVTEGNLESDWALWEDSVAFQDSQMPSAFNELQAVRVRDEPHGQAAAPDPYAQVRRRGR